MIDVLRSQLLALKAQIDAMLTVLDSVTEQERTPSAETGSACPHPETVNVGTFGMPEYRCTICKASVPAPVG